jgi:nucleoside-diphosphate-sugar epimerase
VGTNVFVLFDTSNYMYRGFVYASDAIADFVRGLDKSDSVAVYTFSRNLSRPRRSRTIATTLFSAFAKPWPATTPRSTTGCCSRCATPPRCRAAK